MKKSGHRRHTVMARTPMTKQACCCRVGMAGGWSATGLGHLPHLHHSGQVFLRFELSRLDKPKNADTLCPPNLREYSRIHRTPLPRRPHAFIQAITMLTESQQQIIQTIVDGKKHLPGGLLPMLHDIQDALGHIPAPALGLIAQELNLSRAEVHGVVTFYHFFRHEPAGKQVVQICRAEACQSMGADKLWEHACSRLNTQGGTTADGAVTLEPVYCLGLCSSSPAMIVDEQLHARVDTVKFDRLVAATGSVA